MSTPFELTTPRGDTLHGIVTPANRPGRRPAVVVSHGFKGFQEWCFIPFVADLLASRGFTVIRFNYSGTGMRPGDAMVTDLEAFREATFSKDLEELLWLLRRLPEIDPQRIDPERVGLFGHSRGGGISILAAARQAEGAQVGALVTWAAVSTFDRTTTEEKAVWREQGMVSIVNARTGQELPLGVALLDDIEANAAALDVGRAAGELAPPWLIVHGRDDETVPVEEARQLHSAAPADASYVEIEGTGHTLGVGHPFQAPSRELITAMNATQSWFRRHLGE